MIQERPTACGSGPIPKVRGRTVLTAILSLVLVAVLLPTSASAAECTDTWKGGAEGAWGTTVNWSTSKVPGSTDVACIGSGATVTVGSGANQVGMVQGEGSLVLSSSSLELTGTVEASSIRGLTLKKNGVLKGAGSLKISSSFLWTAEAESAALQGKGSIVVESGAEGTIAVPSPSYAYLYERKLVNRGSLALPSGYMKIAAGGELVNEGTFSLDSQQSPSAIRAGEGKSAVVNTGTLSKNSGTGEGAIAVPLENLGTVRAASGHLAFDGGGSSSGSSNAWEASEGSQLVFRHRSYLLNGGTLVGAMSIVNNGNPQAKISLTGVNAEHAQITVDVADGETGLEITGGTVTVEQLTMIEGVQSGPGTLAVAKLLTFASLSALGYPGTTEILSGAKGVLEFPTEFGYALLYQHRLVNRGNLTLTRGFIEGRDGGEIVNLGTFTVNSEHKPAIKNGTGASSKMSNAGTLQKTAGTGTSQIEVPFENSGTVKETSGHIEIQHKVSLASSTATPHHACSGDPVDCGTGNFTETQGDFQIGGRGVGLHLTRTYSAQAAVGGSLGIFGYGWTNSFGDKLASEEAGAKQTLTEASGDTVTFTKSGAAWIAPSWSADLLTGSTESGFTLTVRDQTKEKFNGSGRLESVTDRDGNETTLAYNGSGKLETITDPSGRQITLTYNAEGLVEKAKDPMGHEVRYVYESKQLKSVTLPGEVSPRWQFKYDASHRMTSFTDGRGGKTTNEYDASNRVMSQTDPMEHETTWEYAPFHTKITNKATGAVTDEWFNSNNQPMSITRGYGTAAASTESFTYTAAGLLASKTDGNGHTTTFEYDANGNRIKETDPEGDETRWTFNEAHQILTGTTPNGEKTTIVRDANGNPETVSHPAPESKTQTVSFVYGAHGEAETMTDPLGHVWSYEYDKYGDRTAATDPEGEKRTWTYDEDSRAISSVSPRGNEEGAEAAKFTASVERDAQGRPFKITDPLGGATKYAYDADGNLESVTDPNGRKTKFTYDADNELTKVEHANKAVEETGYDGAGQVTSQTDGNKQKTTYVRNILEQPIETIDPLERKTIRTFDAAGNLKTLKDPDGRTTTYSYDKADRLTGVAYSDGITPNASFAYDKDGNLTGMVDGTGESIYEYDQLDRLTHSKNGNGETVGWEYNLGDEPTGLTYPNGKSISRAYDKSGRLESVTDWLGHTTSFAYNGDSGQIATSFPVGTGDTDEDGYDRADRIASVTMKEGAKTLASLDYTRDPAGQLASLISKGLPGAETESFSYDENERLTKAGVAEFGYDAANNPTKAPGTTNAFDKASQLESATGATFTYNKEGERTKQTPSSGPATTYKYDQAGDLTAVERTEEGETPAIAESFGYDGSGLMASRTVGLSTNHLVWDVTEAPEALLSDGDNSYLYGPGGLAFEQISSGEVPTYLHHDQLGSTRLLTNGAGETAATFTFGAFGGLLGKTGTATTALGYAGQFTLGQSSLQYLRARYYDPATAQFLTLDPAVGATRAPYFYSGDNPANRRDRSGRAEESIGGTCPSPVCYPFPTWGQAESAAEGIEGALGELGGAIGGLFGGGSSSTPSGNLGGIMAGLGAGWATEIAPQVKAVLNEAEDEANGDVPCETNVEIGDGRQEFEKAKRFVEQEEIATGTNPRSPLWPPSGSRIEKIIAILGGLIRGGHH